MYSRLTDGQLFVKHFSPYVKCDKSVTINLMMN